MECERTKEIEEKLVYVIKEIVELKKGVEVLEKKREDKKVLT